MLHHVTSRPLPDIRDAPEQATSPRRQESLFIHGLVDIFRSSVYFESACGLGESRLAGTRNPDAHAKLYATHCESGEDLRKSNKVYS